jgi:FemAB-related protein (PEP-CTERM system-associated)
MHNEIDFSEQITSEQWSTFVLQSPSATCFHLWGWGQVLEQTLGYEIRRFVARRNNQVIGVFAVAIVRSKVFGNSMVCLPFCSYGGPISDDAYIVKALQERAYAVAKEAGVAYFEDRVLEKTMTAQDHHGLYFAFRKAIPEGSATMSFVPSKRRNMIRRATAAGLTASEEKNVDLFFELYAENARAHGTPALPKKFFVALLDALGEHVDVLFVKDASGKAISVIMSFYFRGEVHAGFAGELSDARLLAANDFKYWSLYESAVRRGCTVFDLGRSKRGTGSYEFKRLWGLEPTPIVHHFQLVTAKEKPSNNPSNPKFSLAIKIWSKLPRLVVDRIGPMVIHGLG